MNKKIILTVTLFVLLLVAVPLFQTLFFSHQSVGGILIDEPIDAPYLKDSKKDLSLVFFGYVGCTRVCTPILYQLDDFYDSPDFTAFKTFVGITFINLKPDVGIDQPKSFAQSFNPQFEGVYLTQKELMGIDREFSVFFSKSLSEKGEIDHSDHIYLIERTKNGIVVLKNIYTTHPINRTVIISDIQKILNEKK